MRNNLWIRMNKNEEKHVGGLILSCLGWNYTLQWAPRMPLWVMHVPYWCSFPPCPHRYLVLSFHICQSGGLSKADVWTGCLRIASEQGIWGQRAKGWSSLPYFTFCNAVWIFRQRNVSLLTPTHPLQNKKLQSFLTTWCLCKKTEVVL